MESVPESGESESRQLKTPHLVIYWQNPVVPLVPQVPQLILRGILCDSPLSLNLLCEGSWRTFSLVVNMRQKRINRILRLVCWPS